MKSLKIIIVIFSTSITYGQVKQEAVLQWSEIYDSPGTSLDVPNSYAFNQNNNLYLAGYSQVVGMSGIRKITTIRYSASGQTTFFERYDSLSTGTEFTTSIVVDYLGALYESAISYPTNTSSEVLLIRYSNKGNIDWTIHLPVYPYNAQLVIDSEENVFIGVSSDRGVYIWKFNQQGSVMDSTIIRTGDTTSFGFNSLIVSRNGDIYIVGNREYEYYDGFSMPILYTWGELVKLDTHCNLIWRRTLSKTISRPVIIDQEGNLIVTSNEYVEKFSSEGDSLSEMHTISQMTLMDVAIDSHNNIIVGGYTTSPSIDSYILKYDATGYLKWDAIIAVPGRSLVECYALTLDSTDNIYLTGSTSGVECLIEKLDSSGIKAWSTLFARDEDEFDEGSFIAIGDSGNVFVGGFCGTSSHTYNYNFLALKYGQKNIKTSVESVHEKFFNFKLFQNYPNPFNPSTTISFNLPLRSHVTLKIFDLIGREVATIVSEELQAGNHSQQWNAANMPSGIYFYRLQAGLFTETKKLILLK